MLHCYQTQFEVQGGGVSICSAKCCPAARSHQGPLEALVLMGDAPLYPELLPPTGSKAPALKAVT